jgi:hypothetical protein
MPSLVLCKTRFGARTSLLSAERFGLWTDYVNNGYIIGNVETRTLQMLLRLGMVFYCMLRGLHTGWCPG